MVATDWTFVSSVAPIQNVTHFPPTFVPPEVTFGNHERLLSRTSYLEWPVKQ